MRGLLWETHTDEVRAADAPTKAIRLKFPTLGADGWAVSNRCVLP